MSNEKPTLKEILIHRAIWLSTWLLLIAFTGLVVVWTGRKSSVQEKSFRADKPPAQRCQEGTIDSLTNGLEQAESNAGKAHAEGDAAEEVKQRTRAERYRTEIQRVRKEGCGL